jgi:predicted ATP-grasp superfamily ATP-dependent carboligase
LPDIQRHVLVAGVSARAAAESAARAGFRVTAIDAFGDLDQHPSVTVHTVSRTFTANAAARAARGLACDTVAYLSSFENHPTAVAMLTAGRALWGNPPDVLQRVRNPRVLSHALRRRGFAVPTVLSREPGTFEPLNPSNLSNPSNPESSWLVKPLSSGGGRRVRRWRPGTRVPRGCYLQEFIEGVPGSIVFAAAGGRAVPLGLSQQRVGESAFGAEGYQYCGSILTPGDVSAGTSDRPLFDDACALCEAVADEFGLVGVNGIDFVARNGRANAVEVNPRWSASMELVELAYGLSVFSAHAGACADGVLPMFNLLAARRDSGAVGKAIVFARTDTVVGDTRAWLSAPPVQRALPAVRDIPHRGERIAAGQPVCTVFAAGRDTATCHAALVERAHHVYAALAEWAREVA